MNIDGFFSTFILMILQGARTTYSILDSITFRGTSLLKYSIALLLVSVVVSLVVTLVRSDIVTGAGRFRDSRSKARMNRKEGSSDD